LPKILKPGNLIATQEVVQIPDVAPPPPPVVPVEEPLEEEQEIAQETVQQEQEPPAALQEQWKALSEKAIERANDASQKILQRAREEREALLEQAQKDAQRIRQEAQQAGYQQALEEKQTYIGNCLSEVEELMNELKQQLGSFLKQYEDGLFSLCLDITKKVLGTTIAEHEELMLPLIKDAVATVRNADWIGVQVSEKLPRLVQMLKSELAQRQDFGPLEVTTADIPADSCIINTPDGIVDASVCVQLENLKTQLEKSSL